MSKYWSRLAMGLEPYVPGEQLNDKKYIKLNTNENPYPPSQKVLDAIKAAADDRLRLYPDPDAMELKKALAEHYGFNENQIFTGNGSDEILAFCFMAFFNPDEEVLFPDVTYSFYPVYARIFNVKYKEVPINDDFSIPIEKMYNSKGGILLPNPNAPTAMALSHDDIEKIIINNRGKIIIIDEAYVDFGADSVIDLISKYDNLLVVQTSSKSRSLAGLRVGWAFGREELIKALERVKNCINSYTLDRLAIAGAASAVDDEEYFQIVRKKIISTRERIIPELEKIGFNVVPSKSNFIFMTHERMSAEKIFLGLKEEGVLVRYFNKPRINNYLRVSIGTDKEMDTLINKLEGILNMI